MVDKSEQDEWAVRAGGLSLRRSLKRHTADQSSTEQTAEYQRLTQQLALSQLGFTPPSGTKAMKATDLELLYQRANSKH